MDRTAHCGHDRDGDVGRFGPGILDLDPDTADEVEPTMTSPDGVLGKVSRRLPARTRPEQMPYGGGRTFHCYPRGPPDSAKIQPAFEGPYDYMHGTPAPTWAVILPPQRR